MSEFQHFSARKSEIIDIPNGLGPYVIGTKKRNAVRIEKLSGAKISFNLKPTTHSAKITGTPSERKQAKALINESISRYMSRPEFGTFLLDNDRFEDIKYRFVEFDDYYENIMNKYLNTQKYIIKRVKESEFADMENRNLETTNTFNRSTPKCYMTRSVLESGSFGTLDRLNECLKNIFLNINGPSIIPRESGSQFKFRVFFGRQAFLKVDPRAIYSVDDFCRFNRHSEDFCTLFAHDMPQTCENVEKIREKFKLKSDDGNKDNRSISIICETKDKERKKIKLRWSEEDGLWEIERVVKNGKRHAIISIVSGTEVPDLRFMVKTKCDIRFIPKLREIIKDLQLKRPAPDENGMWFKLADFEGKLDCIGVCISVRQKTNKTCYSNDRFKIITVTETQEIRGYDQVNIEHNISLKNLRWRKNSQKACKPAKINFDDNDVTSIYETIEFARRVAKSIC